MIKDNSEGGSCVTPLTAHSPGSLDGNALFIEDTSTRIEALHIQMCLSLLEAYPMFLHCQDFNEDEDVSVLEYCQVPQGERPWVLCMEEKKVVVTGMKAPGSKLHLSRREQDVSETGGRASVT